LILIFKYPTDQLTCKSEIGIYELNSRVVLGGKLENRKIWFWRVQDQWMKKY